MLLVCGLVAVAVRAETPTTKPAAKPSAAAVVVDNPTYHYRISLPKTWTAKQKSPKTSVYELPGVPGASSGGVFIMLAGKPNKDTAKLEDIVNGKKEVLTQRNAKTKFVTDEATTLGGEPAWRLVYDVPTTAKETQTINGKPAEVKDVQMAQHSVEIMCVKEGTVVDLMYVGVAENAAKFQPAVDAAFASFEWAK